MKTINYNLRSLSANKETSIMLVFQLQGKRLRMSCREKIKVEVWDMEKQRAKNLKNTDNKALNKRLDNIEAFVQAKINQGSNKYNQDNLHFLKQEIEQFIFQQHKTTNTSFFWDKYDEFISYKSKTTASSKDYSVSLKKHLRIVEKKLGITLTFEALHYSEKGFIDHFRSYLTYEAANKLGKIGLSTNTIWKQFKNLRAFLNWCFDQNYVSKFSTKHIQTKNEQVYNVYLTKDELIKLENLDLSGEERTVRDLFLISCETGLRFSDICELKPQHIKETQFEVFPKKTRKNDASRKVIIPFSQRVKRIVTLYQGCIPTYAYSRISNYNKILRSLCEKAEIDEPCFHYRILQGKECVVECKKYELVSSHTGRRTFCTLKFLDGMPVHVIMKFSGHTSEQNFLRYLKLDAELTAEKYREFF